jgi:hypothetical protein
MTPLCNTEIDPFIRASDRLVDAIEACGRGALRDAMARLSEARKILEVEQEFRESARIR